MNNNANLKMTRNGNEMQRKPSGGGRKQIEKKKKKKSEMNIQHGLELRESKRKKSSVKGYKQKGTK